MTQLVHDVVDELLLLATSQGCKFSVDFKDKIIEEFKRTTTENIMWQDYQARRPMEVETYLGSPIRLSQETGTRLPRIETLYAVLHNLNTINRNRPKSDAVAQAPGSPPPGASPALRMSGQGHPRSMSNGVPNGMPNGNGMRPRPRTSSQLGPPRRGPPSMNGAPPNGYGRPPMNGMPNGRQPSRRGSLEGTDLEEFSHLVVYDDIPEGGEPDFVPSPQAHDLVLRERELQLRQREMALREQEMRMRRGPPGPGPGPGSRRGGPVMRNGSGMMGAGAMEDDDDDDDYFDPTAGPVPAKIDPDNFDMMSVTSRKNRKAPSATPAQFRKNPEYDTMPARNSRFRPNGTRNRSSQMMNSIPSPLENIMDDPLLGFTSNRYGAVDRGQIHAESRANSLTAAHLSELQFHQGPPPPGMRRSSQSPGNHYTPSIRGGGPGRPSPPIGHPGPHMNGRRASPPDGMRQPVPRYSPGHGNAVVPQQVEQHAGVSALQPPKAKNVRSLTGSASASAGSGDSTQLDSEPSAHSSQTSLGPRPPIGVR